MLNLDFFKMKLILKHPFLEHTVYYGVNGYLVHDQIKVGSKYRIDNIMTS